jgi:CubicO group peptidase (beta-lactamase class C family)
MRPATRLSRQRPALLALLAAVVALAACRDAAGPTLGPVDLSAPLAASSPAAEGFDAAALDAAFELAAGIENLRALVVVRNGRLVREAYFNGTDAGSFLDMRSVTKTVTALVMGIAADSGYLDVDDAMADWLAGYALRPAHDGIRLGHLLTMTSGIRWSDQEDFGPWALSGIWVDYVLDLPVVAPPGDAFIYNTGGSHLLSVITGRAAGRSMYDLALDRLLAPLGVGDPDFLWWVLGPDPAGGAGFAPRARDAAKIGQLLLQRGRSGHRQVISEAWIDEVTTPHYVFGGSIGGVLDHGAYGYQLWLDTGPEQWVAWGFGGQFIWVVPSKELVVVTASHWGEIGYDGAAAQARANAALIRDHVIPAAL